jgi:ABC-2 type transport system ATP-binding protein
MLLNIDIIGETAQREKAAELLQDQPIVEQVQLNSEGVLQVTLSNDVGPDDYADLPTLLIENGLKIRTFREDEINLETAFMALTKGITA